MSTTREGRFGENPAQWIASLTEARGIEARIIDLRDYAIPFFRESLAPAYAPPANEAVGRWSRDVAACDGYIFVTAEYNHGIPAVLKNALDHSHREFAMKPAAFVGYGGVGAARAVEQLRLIAIELDMAPLRNAVHIAMESYLAVLRKERTLDDFVFLRESATSLLDDLIWWMNALKSGREAG